MLADLADGLGLNAPPDFSHCLRAFELSHFVISCPAHSSHLLALYSTLHHNWRQVEIPYVTK